MNQLARNRALHTNHAHGTAVLIVLTNAGATPWHHYVLTQLGPPMTPVQVALFGIAINIVPLLAATLVWYPFRSGAWLLAAFFGAVAVIGTYEHFVGTGPDNVFTMADGPWRWSFRASATLLLLVDALGCLFGLVCTKMGGRGSSPSEEAQ